jgi:hypothetical protein
MMRQIDVSRFAAVGWLSAGMIGTSIILAATFLIPFARTELQHAADAGAFAGAAVLTQGEEASSRSAESTAEANTVLTGLITLDSASSIQVGVWDPVRLKFTQAIPGLQNPNAVKVTCELKATDGRVAPWLSAFARLVYGADVTAEAIAYRPSPTSKVRLVH